MQFQAPQGVGLYTWRIHFISDTFVGEDVSQDLTVSHPALFLAANQSRNIIAKSGRSIVTQ
jgi:hypothetical protein